MAISITKSITVALDGGKPCQLPEDLFEIKGERYFVKMAQGRSQIMTLLGARPNGQESRPLSLTNIIETLTKLRDDAIKELCEHEVESRAAPKPMIDLGLDEEDPTQKTLPWRKLRKTINIDSLPDTIEIRTPAIGDVPSIDIEVLRHGVGTPLWVELTADALRYLRVVVQSQISEGTIKRMHPRLCVPDDSKVVVDKKGSSYSYARGCYVHKTNGRVKYARTCEEVEGFDRCKPEEVEDQL